MNHPQGVKHDAGKLELTDIPPAALQGALRAFKYGRERYGPGHHRSLPDGRQRYFNAIFRHMLAVMEAEENGVIPIDPESGLRHEEAIAANALLFLDLSLSTT